MIDRNSPLVNYRIPTERAYRRIMYLPKWGFYLGVENKNLEFPADDVLIYFPFYRMHEKYAVNLYFSVFSKPHEFLRLVAVEEKRLKMQ